MSCVQLLRAVLSSYITKECAQGLKRSQCMFEPIGLAGIPMQNFGLITCKIKSRKSSGPVLQTDTVVVFGITVHLPSMAL